MPIKISSVPSTFLVASLFILAASATPSEAQGQSSSENQFDRGGCVRGPVTDLAMQACDQLIAVDPNDPDLFLNRGNGWLRKNEIEKAEADFQQARKIKPDYFRVHSSIAIIASRRGDQESAISAFSEAIRLNPDDLNAYANRAQALIKTGASEKAIADLNEAIRRNPNYTPAYRERGSLWLTMREFDKSIADFGMAITLDPSYQAAYVNRGLAFARKGDFDKAIEDNDQAIRLNPKLYIAYGNRGIAWNGKGEYDRAISDFNETIRINPNQGSVYAARAFSWLQMNKNEKSIADSSEAIKLDPKYTVAYTRRGDAYYRMGDYDKVIADYNEAIKLDPNSSRSYTARGNAWYQKKELEKAIADYSTAVRLDPANDLAKSKLQIATERKLKLEKASTPSVGPVATGGRVALVIGNSKYTHAPSLKNPVPDAQVLAATLKSVGFVSVTVKTDLTRDGMLQALREFETASKNADWAVVYYAGHGVEVDGVNYMIPVNAQLKDQRNVAREAVHLGQALNSVELAKKLRLVILDACRDNPFAVQMRKVENTRSVGDRESSTVGKGLARVEPDAGTLVVYAAKHGEFALDGDGKNSPFVEAVIKRIKQKPSLEVRRLFDFVREDVLTNTKKGQQPFSYGSLSAREDFYFAK